MNRGLSNLAYLKANNHLNWWDKEGDVISLDSMQDAMRGIERARELHPQHPHYMTIKAQLHEWRGYSGIDPDADQREDYRQALALYRQSIEQRPLWPNSYVSYAMTKWRLNEWDSDMRWAILKADQFGPYTPEVHSGLVQIGFEEWRRQPGERPDYLQRHVVRGAHNPLSRRELEGYFTDNKIPRLVACRWLKATEDVKPLRVCGK